MGTGDYSRVDIGYMQPPKALEYKSSYKLSDYCRSCNSTKSIYHHSHAISNRYEKSFSKKCSNLVTPIFVFRTNSSTLPTSITEPLLHPSQSNSSRSIIPFTNKQLNEAAISDGVRGSTTKPYSNSSKNDSLRYSFRSFKWKPRIFTVCWALLRPPSTWWTCLLCKTVRFQLSKIEDRVFYRWKTVTQIKLKINLAWMMNWFDQTIFYFKSLKLWKWQNVLFYPELISCNRAHWTVRIDRACRTYPRTF